MITTNFPASKGFFSLTEPLFNKFNVGMVTVVEVLTES